MVIFIVKLLLNDSLMVLQGVGAHRMGNYGNFEERGAEIREHGNHVGLKILDILRAHVSNFDLVVVILLSLHVFLD